MIAIELKHNKIIHIFDDSQNERAKRFKLNVDDETKAYSFDRKELLKFIQQNNNFLFNFQQVTF